MRFGGRKSSLALESVQDEAKGQRRNRLSKPPNGKITPSASATSLQEPVSRSKSANAPELVVGGPLSSHPHNRAIRRQIRNEVFDSDHQSPTTSLRNESSWNVAYMVKEINKKNAQVETTQPEQPPASPAKPQKRKSLVLRRLSLRRSSSLTRTPSNERISSLKSHSATPSTPDTSLDRIVDSPSIPSTRRASFTPGTATRKEIPTQPKQEKVFEETEEQHNVLEAEDVEWQPPPPRMTGRAGTPADLDYSQLGGLRHGSLQIVNGRASPAFSEMSKISKHLFSVPTAHRDVSSDYGDAEEEFEQLILGAGNSSRQNTPDEGTERQHFSWESDKDNAAPRIHPLHNVISLHPDVSQPQDEDQTSLMAREYIAELPASPFDMPRSRSPVGTIRRTRSEGSLWRSSSDASLQKSTFPDSQANCSPVSSLERSPSPTGSVVRRRSGETERGRARSREEFQADVSEHERQLCDSAMSWYSPTEPSFEIDEAFQSAVEFQPQLSPTRLQPPRASEKSDSGYSSSNSLRSVHLAKAVPTVEIEARPPISASPIESRPLQPERKPALLGRRPSILKSRKTEPNLPTFANIRPTVMSSKTAPVVPPPAAAVNETTPAKLAKGRKKLQKKKRPLSLPPSKIAVVRVSSFDEDDIPQIPAEVRENLRIRSQKVPELQKTYVSLNQMSNQASISNMDLPMTEFRFPSPAPEQALQVKRSRSRSRSRPRSWFGRPKEENSMSRRNSGISQAEARAIINDFGTVAISLGSSPYDITYGNGVSDQVTSPFAMSTAAPRPRSMMDDKMATELARLRSRSIQERDSILADRRPLFNDRGGIPGKNLRPASFISDAPPITPEMLQKRSSSMRQASMESSTAPPPPSHSPRPCYVDYEEDYFDMAVAPPPPSHSPRPLDITPDAAFAPPPPSHSPRPMDITPDPWAAHASAWKIRRQSVGRALKRQSWSPLNNEEYLEDVGDEPLYPAIPPRNQQQLGWTQSTSPEEYYHSPQEYYNGYNDSSRSQQHYNLNPTYGDSYQHSDYQDSTYMRPSRRNSMMKEYQQSRGRSVHSNGQTQGRPLPSPRPPGASPHNQSPRPHSKGGSVRSFASSLAEELHPPHLERPHPPPMFGRYSGGMCFGYEPGNGFGGSAGTRSVSGKAEATRKGLPLRASFGVDLGDVPVGIMAR